MAPLFKRSSTSFWHFCFFVVLSSALMFFDHQGNLFTEKMRDWLSVPVKAFRLLVEIPFDFTQYLHDKEVKEIDLLSENKRLQHEQNILSAQLQKWKTIEEENKRLHALLKTRPTIDGQVTGAKITAINIETHDTSSLMLDKGRSDGVYVGQPVLDSKGLLGQVIRVDYFNSIVLLITDLKSAIPVEVLRTGERGILNGTGLIDTLILSDLPKTSDLKYGDLLITSSLAGNFPAGYPVGRVRSVKNTSSNMFAKVDVTPMANIQKDREVFLLWPAPKPHSYFIPIVLPELPSK